MKNLLIAPVGKDSKHIKWLNGPDCHFDFIALCYEDVEDAVLKKAIDVFKNKDYKYSNVQKYVAAHSDILDQYDYLFLPDDDLDMSLGDINRLFEIAEGFQLDLCQPSLTHHSHCSWAITLWCGDPQVILRYTDFVEIMCPLFSKRGMSICMETFGKNRVGMALDFVWPKLLHFTNIAIIDSVRVTHGRPLRDWPKIIDSEEEWRVIRELYDVKIYQPKVYKVVIGG